VDIAIEAHMLKFGINRETASYAYAAFYDYSKPMNGFDLAVSAVSAILCPPQLLFVMCIDCEVIGWDGFIMYSIIAVLNAALYAVIGVIAVAGRKGADSPTSSTQPPSIIRGN
jgi:hypothetical protein